LAWAKAKTQILIGYAIKTLSVIVKSAQIC